MQWTREDLRDAVNNGDVRVVLLNVNLRYADSKYSSNYVKDVLSTHGWTKVGGEGDYRGARGVYARIVPIVDDLDFIEMVAELRTVALGAIDENLQEIATDGNVAEVHVVLSEALLYNNVIDAFLELPRV